MGLYTSSPSINMHILLTILHTLLTVLVGRICVNNKTFCYYGDHSPVFFDQVVILLGETRCMSPLGVKGSSLSCLQNSTLFHVLVATESKHHYFTYIQPNVYDLDRQSFSLPSRVATDQEVVNKNYLRSEETWGTVFCFREC